MDWVKKFRLTIGNIRLGENSQSEKRQIEEKFPDLFRKNTTIKDDEIKIQLKPKLSGKTKSKTNPSPRTRSSQKRNRKTNEIRTLGKSKTSRWRLFCVTVVKTVKNDKSVKNSFRFTKIEWQLHQSPTTNAEHGRIVESNFGRDNKRPNKKTKDIKDRPWLRIRPNDDIRRNNQTMCIWNHRGKLQRLLPI